MRPSELLANIKKGELFANANITRNPAERFGALLEEFIERYGDERDVNLFSVPGRSELAGNHTDHNHGRVIACSVDLDIVAVVAARSDSTVRIKSEGFPEDVVDINEYVTTREDRFGNSDSLIAGVADGFRKRGLAVGGFDAVTSSNVLKGSGISSSADRIASLSARSSSNSLRQSSHSAICASNSRISAAVSSPSIYSSAIKRNFLHEGVFSIAFPFVRFVFIYKDVDPLKKFRIFRKLKNIF